jgi:hypothetical protein
MQHHVRAWIAFVLGRAVSSATALGVYDHTARHHRTITGLLNRGSVSVFDHNRSAHVTGTGSDTQFSLYDHDRRAYVSLTISGTTFNGFDNGEARTFSGRVNGHVVWIYDHADATWSQFSV